MMNRGVGIDIGKPLATDRDMIRAIAKQLFETYDRNHSGAIEDYEMGQMTLDAYKTVNKSVKVDKDDLSCLLEVLDADKDGKVTIYDLERLVEKYLSGVN